MGLRKHKAIDWEGRVALKKKDSTFRASAKQASDLEESEILGKKTSSILVPRRKGGTAVALPGHRLNSGPTQVIAK